MNVSNLQDLESGLNEFHQGSEYLSLVTEELSKRNNEAIEFVDFAPQELG